MKNNKQPFVSVIIPIFNGSSYLEETVHSILKSSYSNIEIILVNDGSKDQSIPLCRKLEKNFKKVKFYSFKKNRGMSNALNFALSKAKGQYICRLNQDDIMLSHRIITQVDFLNRNPKVVAVGSYVKYFEKSNRIVTFFQKDKDIRSIWHIVSPFADPSVMYRKNAAIKLGGYDQTMWPADDTHLWIRMGTIGQLANIPKILVYVRWHENAASIKYFKTLAISTYKMHVWINNHIEKAPIFIHLYWIFQLIAGLVLPPDWNWCIYRFLKQLISKGNRNDIKYYKINKSTLPFSSTFLFRLTNKL